MATIDLVVTQKVLDRVAAGHTGESKIALRAPSAEIALAVSQIRAHKRVRARLGGCVTLVLGDTGAIWRAHNQDHLENFDDLFRLLARRPGVPMRFICELA
jgi:hypothetical protein